MRKCTSLSDSDPAITGITRTGTTDRIIITGLTGTAGIGTTATIVTTITTDTKLTSNLKNQDSNWLEKISSQLHLADEVRSSGHLVSDRYFFDLGDSPGFVGGPFAG